MLIIPQLDQHDDQTHLWRTYHLTRRIQQSRLLSGGPLSGAPCTHCQSVGWPISIAAYLVALFSELSLNVWWGFTHNSEDKRG